MKIAIPKERRAHETRVAGSPETVKKIVGLGCEVVVEKGAGTGAAIVDRAYQDAGAKIAASAKATVSGADVVLKVQGPQVGGKDDELEIRPFIRRVPDDAAALAVIRDEALANPIYAGNLVSEDGRATAIFVYLEDIGDKEFLARDLDRSVAAIAEEERGDAEAWLTGAALVKAETTRMGLADVVRTTPLIAAAMAAIAFVSFRSLRGVIVPMASVGIALVWSLGAIGLSGRPITIISIGDSKSVICVLHRPRRHLCQCVDRSLQGRIVRTAVRDASDDRESTCSRQPPVLNPAPQTEATT